MNYRRKQQRWGMALIAVVLLITSVFVLMTAGAGELLNTSLRQAARAQSNRRTNYCSYAIMQRALDKLSTNKLYSVDPTESGLWDADPELVYELSIYNNFTGAFVNPAPDGRNVPQYMVYVKVKSDYRDYPGRYTSTLFSKAYVGGQSSNFAIVGTGNVTIQDSVVDAWYIKKNGSGVCTLVKSTQGRIVTNSVQPNHINVGGSSNVDAHLYYGPYGPPTVVNVTSTVPVPADKIAPAASPTRVPRYHPPTNPTILLPDQVFTASGSLPKGNYKSLTVTGAGTVLNMEPGEYYFANNITINDATIEVPGATGTAPCDIYLGKTFTASNATINWDHTLKTIAPETPMTSADLEPEGVAGPRSMRVFFVGSGAPNFKDCQFTATNTTKMSLFASGKAMKVEMDHSILWGGLKGFEVNLKNNSELHYQRVVFDT